MSVIPNPDRFVDRHPVAAIWLFCLGLALLTRAVVLPLSVIGLDEGIYFLVAEQLARGNMPFSVYFDHKPVLIYYLLAIWEMVSDDMIFWTRVQQTVVAGASGALAAMLVLGRTGLGVRYALVLGAAYVLLSAPFGGFAAIPENFINLFALAALLIATRDGPLKAGETVLLGGLYALMFNVNYLSALPILGIHVGLIWLRLAGQGASRWAAIVRAHLVAGGAFMAVTGALLVPILLYGDVWGYFSDQIDFVRGYREPAGWRRLALHVGGVAAVYLGFVVPVIIVVVRWMRRGDRSGSSRLQSAGFVYLAFALIACFATGRHYIHYFILLLPGLLMLSAVFVEGSARQDKKRFAGWVLLFALLGFVFAGRPFLLQGLSAAQAIAAGDPPDVNAEIARDIRRELSGSEGGGIYVYHHNAILYHLAGTVAPTRYPFALHHLLDGYGRSLSIDPGAEMTRIVATRPQFIIAGSRPHDGRFGAPSEILSRELDRCYVTHHVYEDFFQSKIYVYRRDNLSNAACEF